MKPSAHLLVKVDLAQTASGYEGDAKRQNGWLDGKLAS